MTSVGLALFGWLVPGGAYLLTRRYLPFASFAVLVSAAFAAGLALQGGLQWPRSAELEGLDTFTALVFQAGALAKLCAGGPFLLAQVFGGGHGFLDGRLHEYGTTLLVLAGLFNVLAVSNALELRKAER
jgi:4-hydroxybenzoate polyprenyltransferase